MKVRMMWGLAAVVQRVTLFQEKWVNPERFYTREWQELKLSILQGATSQSIGQEFLFQPESVPHLKGMESTR